MRKTTFVKLLCLAILCMLLIPMVIACGEDAPELPGGSSNGGTESSNGGTQSSNSGTTEKVTIFFKGNAQGVTYDGDKSVEITKGGKLKETQVPQVFLTGYKFVCWAHDMDGRDPWDANETFKEDSNLYAIWTVSGSTDSSIPGGADSSVPSGTDSSVPSGTDSSVPGGTVTPPADEKVTIEFNTGTGFFEDDAQYETEINKGGRLSTLPTPIHDNPAMLFDGWYKDAAFTQAVSRSDKYDADTMLYAYWIQQAECTDGTYNHLYSTWDEDTKPDCVKAGTVARYCQYCNAKQTKPGDPPKGHQFGQWQEAFMARERICGRPGCGEREVQNFKDVTLEVLGSSPSEQIEGNTDAFFQVPFTALINGTWDESYGKFVGPNGSATAYVIFTLLEPTTLDRIYFKGDGTVNMNIYVQYEGEDDYTFIGLCAGVADKENTPFKEPDTSKKIAKIKFQEENPKRGESLWQEVAFVKVATEEE